MGKRYLVTDGQLEMIKELVESKDYDQIVIDIDLMISRQFIGESNNPVVEDANNLNLLLKSLELQGES